MPKFKKPPKRKSVKNQKPKSKYIKKGKPSYQSGGGVGAVSSAAAATESSKRTATNIGEQRRSASERFFDPYTKTMEVREYLDMPVTPVEDTAKKKSRTEQTKGGAFIEGFARKSEIDDTKATGMESSGYGDKLYEGWSNSPFWQRHFTEKQAKGYQDLYNRFTPEEVQGMRNLGVDFGLLLTDDPAGFYADKVRTLMDKQANGQTLSRSEMQELQRIKAIGNTDLDNSVMQRLDIAQYMASGGYVNYAHGGSMGKKSKSEAKGGEIKGKGGPKSDDIEATIPKGSFIVPAENAPLAEKIRKDVLGEETVVTDEKKSGQEVNLSDGEHLFTPKEVKKIVEAGYDLNELAPNSHSPMEYAQGGAPVTATKAKEILKHGKVHGKELSDKQRKLFGAIAGGNYIKNYKEGGKVGYADGGSVSELWEEVTGTPWSDAKKNGYTDGSMEANLFLKQKLEDGAVPTGEKGSFKTSDKLPNTYDIWETPTPTRTEYASDKEYNPIASDVWDSGTETRKPQKKSGGEGVFSDMSASDKATMLGVGQAAIGVAGALATGKRPEYDMPTEAPRYQMGAPLEEYEISPEIFADIARAERESRKGFSWAEMESIQRGIEGKYQEQVRQATEMGGSAGTVLATSGAATGSANRAYLEAKAMDAEQKRKNRALYSDLLGRGEGMKQRAVDIRRENQKYLDTEKRRAYEFDLMDKYRRDDRTYDIWKQERQDYATDQAAWGSLGQTGLQNIFDMQKTKLDQEFYAGLDDISKVKFD